MVTVLILPACFKRLLVPWTREFEFTEFLDIFANGMPECCDNTVLIFAFVLLPEHSTPELCSVAGQSVTPVPKQSMTSLMSIACSIPDPC